MAVLMGREEGGGIREGEDGFRCGLWGGVEFFCQTTSLVFDFAFDP
jgi:hypothetical protein